MLSKFCDSLIIAKNRLSRPTISRTPRQHSHFSRMHVCCTEHIDFLLIFLPVSPSYNDCMATIRRLPSVEHNFQLVITKVYEDGDQDLLQDEDESEHFSMNTILRA